MKEFDVFDIVDSVMGDGGIFYYRVKWDVYQDPDDDTWERKEALIDDGLMDWLSEVNSYVSWRDVQPESAREQRLTIEKYRSIRKDRPRFAADAFSLCAFATLRKATQLLGIKGFLESFDLIRQYKQGLKLHELHSFIEEANNWQRARKLKELAVPTKKKAWKKANNVKTSGSKYIPLKLQAGVYICGAVSRRRQGHMFVLEVLKDSPAIVHDSTELSSVRYDAKYCVWIKNWSFIIKCNRGD